MAFKYKKGKLYCKISKVKDLTRCAREFKKKNGK